MKKIALVFGGVILLAGTVAFATIKTSNNDCCEESGVCCVLDSECCVK